METRRLRYFLQIADAGSISRAAQALGIAQPALSQQLAVLESEVKSRLFERSPSGVTLTEAGRALYVRAQMILRQVEGLDLDLQAIDEAIAGPVAVGLPPSLGHSVGGALFVKVRQNYPGVRLQLIEAPTHVLTEQLLNGLIDVALTPAQPLPGRFVSEALFREDMMLITDPDAPKPPDDLAALAAMPWVVGRTPTVIRTVMGAAFAQSGLDPRVIAETDSLPVVIDCVAAGLGISLLPRLAIESAVAAGRVKAWPLVNASVSRTIHLCRRLEDQPMRAVIAVTDILRELAIDRGTPGP